MTATHKPQLKLGPLPLPPGQAPGPASGILTTFARIVVSGLDLVVKAFAALQEDNARLRTERDRARAEARLLAHAARAGMKAPEELLERVLAYPALPERPTPEPKA